MAASCSQWKSFPIFISVAVFLALAPRCHRFLEFMVSLFAATVLLLLPATQRQHRCSQELNSGQA